MKKELAAVAKNVFVTCERGKLSMPLRTLKRNSTLHIYAYYQSSVSLQKGGQNSRQFSLAEL